MKQRKRIFLISFLVGLIVSVMVLNVNVLAMESNYELSKESCLDVVNKRMKVLGKSVAMSSNGEIQTVVGVYIHVSNDFGLTWEEVFESVKGLWSSVAMSSDGRIQTAVQSGGYIHVSNDFGLTWEEVFESVKGLWSSVAMSSDGRIQTAVQRGGYIYVSYNSGISWEEVVKPGKGFWTSVAMSDDGRIQTAVQEDGYVYISYNSGTTWSQVTGLGKGFWTSVDMSWDGRIQTVVRPGAIYISNDVGKTWSKVTLPINENWTSVAMSFDGQYQTVVSGNHSIYISKDYGGVWSNVYITETTYWISVAMSSSGVIQTALGDGYIHISDNYGVTWEKLISKVNSGEKGCKTENTYAICKDGSWIDESEPCKNGCLDGKCITERSSTPILPSCPACKAIGDYNCDGKVNGLDYSWWKQEFVDKVQHGGKWEASSDCTVVTLTDYSKWRDNYLK